MNLKKLFLMLTFFVLLGTTAFAQSTLYVDVTNGSDSYTGVNASNNPAGTGPLASFGAARALITNGGTIIIMAGTYAEAFDLSTGLIAATNSYTIQLSQLNSNNVIAFTGGASVINKTGLTVSIGTSVGTENITQTNAAVNMTLGSINLATAAAWVLPSGATINLAGTSGFTNAAPTKTTNISLNYTGGSSFTAGPESNYGSYGTGTITVAKTAGTTVTLPNAITAVAGIIGTSGNGIFSGSVTLGANDVTNNGTGILTFNGAVAFSITDGAAAGNIGSVVNANTGSVVFNSTATWSCKDLTLARVFPAAPGTFVIDNQSTGSILFNSGTTFVPDPTTPYFNATVTASNNAGTLTLGTVTANTANAVSVIVNVINSTASGTLNVAGTLNDLTNNNATATTNIVAATSVAGTFTNAGTTALGNNNLTLSGNSANNTVGGTVTAAIGQIVVTATGAVSFNGGTLANVTNNGAANTLTISAPATFTSLTSTAGTVIVGAAITVGTMSLNGGNITDGALTMTITNYSQSSGTLTLVAGSTLDVKNGFNRTGGTFTAPAGSLVSFTGSGAQSVNGGPLFQVGNLTFNNAGGIITVGNSIRASGAIIIATATNVNFSTTNLIMNGGNAASTITNNGTYTAIGGGGVVVGGINTVTGGVAGAGLGATYTLQGTGTYSYITVDVGAGNFAEVISTVTGVKWNGVLTLRSGTLNVSTAGVDFGPTGSVASIVRYPQDSPGIAVTGGSFNAANVPYDLTYIGVLTANQPVGSELTATPANVRSFTVSTTSVGAFYNDLPATTSLSFGGTLVVSNGAYLRIPANAAVVSFTLTGAGKNHTIAGTLATPDIGAAADAFIFSGAGSTINGSTVITDAATIGNVQFTGTNQTVTNIFSFSGTVTTGAASTVSLGMGTATARRQVTGLLTVGGASLTLTTPIVLNAGAAHSAGIFDFGANTVTLATGGNWLQTGGSYASAGGYLEFDVAGNLTLTSALPYLRAKDVAITLGAAATISQNLDITGATPLGAIVSGGFNLTISNTMTTNAGPVAGIFQGAGALVLTGASPMITASGNPLISNLTINSTGTATLATSDPTTPTPVTYTIGTLLTQTAGDLAIGINNVALSATGAVYTRTTATGEITQSSGELQFTGAGLQTAAQGTGFTIPNLTINNTGAGVTFAGGATNDFVVTGTLKLTTGAFSSTAAGKLHIGNLATIEIFATASSLTQVPTFDGDVNLSYRGATGAIMAKEMPTAASNKLNNMLVNMAGVGNTVATAVAGSWKGTLTLTLGTFNSAFAFTGAPGATIAIGNGVLGFAPTVTNYNVTYNAITAANINTTANELQQGTGITVNLLTVNVGAGKTVTLDRPITVNNLTITSGSMIFNAPNDLTILGTIAGGGTFTGTANLVFSGATAQTITAPAGGLTLGGNLTINNAAGVSLVGGDLIMGAGFIVTFTNGNLITGVNGSPIKVNGAIVPGANSLVLSQSNTGPGFVTVNGGHVIGNVREVITAGAGSPTVHANGRYEFPVGTATEYRPFIITFSSTYPAINPTSVTVNNINTTPGGYTNLPLDAGNGLMIGSYPAYYWLVSTSPSSFTSTQNFDVEMHGTNIGIFYTSDQNLRIIKRQDGSSTSNGWSLQGTSANYSNYSVYNGTDTTAVVRTTSSIGGIVNEGTRFAIGVPARVPTFSGPLTFTVAEGATTNNTVQVTATPNNSGETITSYAKVSGPSFAAVSNTGLVTLTPGYSDASATPYPVVISATTSAGLSAQMTLNVTVTNSDRAPSFTLTGALVNATGTVTVAKTLSLTYKAIDPDGDAITYSVTADKAVSALPTIPGGVLSWTPTFADAALSPVTFTITASSGTPALTATTTTVVTVSFGVAVGDINGDGSITSADASLILQYVVGLITLTPLQLHAADVNGDGKVGALDAAWILYYSINGTWPSAKAIATEGNVQFGKFVADNEVMRLPISLLNTKGVRSFYAEVALGTNVVFKSVKTSLPDGWQIASNVENGVLKIAMAGINTLVDGNLAVIELSMKNKESIVSIQGSVKMNDELDATMQPVQLREIPTNFSLSQNYPNPFNPTTNINYSIPSDATVKLSVYNSLGQVVKTLVNVQQKAGYYSIRWDGANESGSKVASGMYIYRITAGSYIHSMKMNLIK
jgi:hypothetical protein